MLIDSEVISARVEFELWTAIGFPMTPAQITQRFLGKNWAHLIPTLEAEFGREVPASFREDARTVLAAAFERELTPMPGIHDLLGALPDGIARCVASSSSLVRLEHSLGLTGLWRRFAPHVFSAQQVKNGKPAPDLFLFAAEQMNIRPDKCLVLEDSEAGIEAAIRAGMRVVGFSGGSHCGPEHADKLRAKGAEQVISRLMDLRSFVA